MPNTALKKNKNVSETAPTVWNTLSTTANLTTTGTLSSTLRHLPSSQNQLSNVVSTAFASGYSTSNLIKNTSTGMANQMKIENSKMNKKNVEHPPTTKSKITQKMKNKAIKSNETPKEAIQAIAKRPKATPLTATAVINSNVETPSACGIDDQGQGRSVNQLEDEQQSSVDLSTLPTDVYQSSETETAEQIVEARGYVLQEKLGAGAFATVYKAWHVHEQFFAACKVIEMRKKKRKRLNDLKHELYVLERMEHAHIVKLYEHFIIDERVYIFMECASGGTLSEYVRRRGPLRELLARRWFKQICSAVHHMHTRGISHRDLKLGNILLDEQKQCKVTDFGLSRVSYRLNQGILYCNSYCGTEPYMSPEILKKDELGKRCYDPLVADIWALGVCLYAMINKAYPFNPEDKETMIVNQLQRKWKFVKKQRYRLSNEVKDLVRHMLEPDPKKRITFLGIASHPWMTEQLIDTEGSDEENVIFTQKPKLKVEQSSNILTMNTMGKSKNVTPTTPTQLDSQPKPVQNVIPTTASKKPKA